jgi:ABC-type Fe3+ transport system substrate-binding protein
MAGHSPTDIKGYVAGAAMPKRRIAKFGAADGVLLLAAGAAATEFSIGVTTEVDTLTGEPVDLIRAGLADVEYGGTIVRGAPLTSDATGRAVTAAPAAGTNNRIIGFAEVSGVVGDIGTVYVNPGFMQG